MRRRLPRGVEFCRVMDHEEWLVEHPVPAASKVTAAVTAGEPGTVRMIYFLPNDRPYRQSVVDTMKARMVRLQAFFGEQMESHGYGYKTFRCEADAAMVTPWCTAWTATTATPIISMRRWSPCSRRSFANLNGNTGYPSSWWTPAQAYCTWGVAPGMRDSRAGAKMEVLRWLAAASFSGTAAHELTHAFGLMWHDFRDDTYILSYGAIADRLSACSARYLAVTPFLNPEIPLGIDRTSSPTIEFAGATVWYAPGTERFTVPWRVADPDGIHQVIQWTGNPLSRSLTPEVKACRDVAGETEAVVSFEYDGAIPSLPNSSFSYPTSHMLPAKTVDTQGHRAFFSGRLVIAQASPHHVATLKVETIFLYDIAISPGGDLLAVGTRDSYTQEAGRGQDGHVRLWDVARREEVASLVGHWHSVYSVAFSPDGGLLASAGVADDTVKLWDVARREAVATFEGHTGTIESVAFSPDGGLLASAGWDRTVRVWDVAARQEVAVLDRHTETIESVAFSPDGGLLASAGRDRTVRVWDVAARQEVAVLDRHTAKINSVAFSPAGGLLASAGGVSKNVRLWDTATWNEIAVLTRPGAYAAIVAGVFSRRRETGSQFGTWNDLSVGRAQRRSRGAV